MSDLYKQAGSLYSSALSKGGSLKSIVYNNKSNDGSSKRAAYALTVETLKYRGILEELIVKSGLSKDRLYKKSDPNVLRVVVYDLMIGEKGDIIGGGALKKFVLGYKTRMNEVLVRMKIKAKVSKNEDLLPAHVRAPIVLPRYARVNTLKIKTEKAIEKFTQIMKFRTEPITPSSTHFTRDIHFPDILIFPPNTKLHDHPMVLKGEVILQDKASCVPPYILNPTPGSKVIDACASPGNKTTLLAAILNNKGKIFGVDRDPKRLETLKMMVGRVNASCVETVLSDFLNLSPDEPRFRDVKYILLDPSCSGSGIVGRIDSLIGEIRTTEEKPNENDKKKKKKKKKKEKVSQEEEKVEEEEVHPENLRQQRDRLKREKLEKMKKEGLYNEEDDNDDNNSSDNNIDNNNQNENGEGSSNSNPKGLKRKHNDNVDGEQRFDLGPNDGEHNTLDNEKEKTLEERLASLSKFQILMLLHAMNFPSVEKIVYSTCSIHSEENEKVVSEVLQKNKSFDLIDCFPEWKRRGQSVPGLDDSLAKYCVRMQPDDNTIGFFVACFQRKGLTTLTTTTTTASSSTHNYEGEIEKEKENDHDPENEFKEADDSDDNTDNNNNNDHGGNAKFARKNNHKKDNNNNNDNNNNQHKKNNNNNKKHKNKNRNKNKNKNKNTIK